MAELNVNTNQGEIRYLTPLDISTKNKKKYCRFKRLGIKHIDYKDPDFLLVLFLLISSSKIHFLF